jgi:hypothetical protein
VEVSITGSDGGVSAQKSASDTDAGLSGTIDLTVEVPTANLGLCAMPIS